MILRVVFILFSLGISSFAQSQFGFQMVSGYNYFSEKSDGELISPEHSPHIALGPSYWFRLKQKRIEFNPSILLDYSVSNYSLNTGSKTSLDEITFILNFPILIYPMDFGNDCNCPTFNKSGQMFEKGFYFLLYPALPYSSKKIQNSDDSFSKSYFSVQLGLGAGMDIGINKKWTISPALMISKVFQDANILDSKLQILPNENDSRIRIDFMLRVILYNKKKRY